MTREKFLEILKSKNIDYIDKGNYLIITENNYDINLSNIISISCNIEFNNNGDVNLENIKEILGNVIFSNNVGFVFLPSLEKVTDKVQFNNGGSVNLINLKYLNKNIILNNEGDIYLGLLEKIENRYIFNKKIKNVHIKKLKEFPLKVKFYNEGEIEKYSWSNSNFIDNIKKYCPQGINYKRFLGGYNK